MASTESCQQTDTKICICPFIRLSEVSDHYFLSPCLFPKLKQQSLNLAAF